MKMSFAGQKVGFSYEFVMSLLSIPVARFYVSAGVGRGCQQRDCGRKPTSREVHHKIPRARGDGTDQDNLMVNRPPGINKWRSFPRTTPKDLLYSDSETTPQFQNPVSGAPNLENRPFEHDAGRGA